MIKNYLDSIIKRDPAARNKLYVILTYPGVKAVFFHYAANKLWKMNLFIISKMLSDDSDVSILSSYVPDNKISSTGTILLDGNSVLQILEKQEHSPSNIAWAGVAFFHDCIIFEKIQ